MEISYRKAVAITAINAEKAAKEQEVDKNANCQTMKSSSES